MNIAFVNSTRKWGGVKTWCINTASELARIGVRSVIFGSDERFIGRAGNQGIEAHQIYFGSDYNPVLVKKFHTFFKERNIACVIVNVGKDLKSAGFAARMAGIPIIHRIGSPNDIRNTAENRILQHIIRPSMICCSEFTRQGLLQNLPYLGKFNTTTIHPGVEISEHSPVILKTRTLITTSQLNEDKRHVDVIDACRILAENGLKFFLKIVGEGRLASKLKDQVGQNGLNSYIQFTGYTNDVVGELRSADIFILPTHSEPLGIALEEAMANGLIPIARNAGGVPEIWPRFLPTHLLPQDSGGQAFASVLSKLIQLPQTEIDEIKTRVRQHAREVFSLEMQSKRVLDFIESLKKKDGCS